MPNWITKIALIVMFCGGMFCDGAADAQVTLTLPLHGYYHPGRYMPVRVVVASPMRTPEELTIHSRGAMSTRLAVGTDAGGTVIVPWLIYDARADALRWGLTNGSRQRVETGLVPLAPDRRLVGSAGPTQVAQALFPGDVIVPLDLSNPLPGPPAAWETLDALVLDPAVLSRLQSGELAALVSAGTDVVVRSSARPDSTWPWQKQGDCWVLHHVPAGPAAAAYDPRVYGPVESWQSGWPVEFRRTLVLFGVFFAIGTVGLVLWRPRVDVLILLLGTAAALGVLGYWWHFQIPVEECIGQIMVLDSDWAQSDYWAYQTSASRMPVDVRWADSTTKPIFDSAAQLDLFAPHLDCNANGDPRYLHYEIPARGKIALLTRMVGPRPRLVQPREPVTSPLRSLVENVYQIPGIAGQLPSTPMIASPYIRVDQWPCVVVERGEKSATDEHR